MPKCEGQDDTDLTAMVYKSFNCPGDGEHVTSKMAIRPLSFEGCTISWQRIQALSGSRNGRSVWTWTVPLSAIGSAKVQVTRLFYFTSVFHTTVEHCDGVTIEQEGSDGAQIHFRSRMDDRQRSSPLREDEMRTSAPFEARDADAAEQIAAHLRKVAAACRSK